MLLWGGECPLRDNTVALEHVLHNFAYKSNIPINPHAVEQVVKILPLERESGWVLKKKFVKSIKNN